jgi:DNA-directed RNA polymerase III subunit RPC1
VFHVGYFKNIIAVLQCVCKSCARVMVPEEERRTYLRKLRNPQTEARHRARSL